MQRYLVKLIREDKYGNVEERTLDNITGISVSDDMIHLIVDMDKEGYMFPIEGLSLHYRTIENDEIVEEDEGSDAEDSG